MNAVLILIESLLPQLGSSAGIIEKIINALIALYPLISAEYADLKPIVANILLALRSDPSTTAAQLDTLDAFEAKLDADYETVAALAAAEDAAAGGKPST
jgi:hypothetical protein